MEACRTASLAVNAPNLQRFGVTSAIRGEGRTSVAVALAAIQAGDYGRSAVLLEMDLESPSFAKRLGARPWPGLSEVVRGEVELERVIQPAGRGLSIVTAGASAGMGARLVTQISRSRILDDMSRLADVVVADLPPVLGNSCGLTAAGCFEELLLVVRAGVTPVGRLRDATSALQVEPAVILNGVSSRLPSWVGRFLDA
jgi:Mrp family chromosome partitioning ATPase